MNNNASGPDSISLRVDRDKNGKIVDWEMTLTNDQAIDMLNKAIHEAEKEGDAKTARVAKMFLKQINKHSKTDRKNKPEKK